jgi:ketopantoate reductase
MGKQYILSAAVLFGASVRAGRVLYPVSGSLLVGEPYDSTGFAESIVALLNGVIPTMYVDNIHGAQWTRLITSLHHGLAAATGLTATQAADDPTLRALSVMVMKEAADLTKQKGIQLQSLPELPPVNKIVSVLHMPPPVSDMIPRLLSRIGREEAAAELIIDDLKHEGSVVIDYLNGEIVQLGQELSASAPYNNTVVRIIKELSNTGKTLTPKLLLQTVEAELQSSIPIDQSGEALAAG